MTRRLYYDDAYTTEFTARLRRVEPRDGVWAMWLEESYFYPTSGGQMHDTGRLGPHRVVDVVEEDGDVVHVVEATVAELPGEGAELAATIDAARRRSHRQQHTGQHVLSRLVEDRLGLPTLSSRLGESGNTLDLATGSLGEGVLAEIEDEANALIWEGRPVNVLYTDPAEAATMGVRGEDYAHRDTLRVIEVEGHDRNPCGGTHVRNTAEIGCIAITRTEKISEGLRVHFLCGERATRHRRERDRALAALEQLMTTGADTLPAAIGRLRQQAKDADKQATQLARELAGHRAAGWLEEAHLAGGVRLVARELGPELAAGMGEAMARLVAEPDVVALLAVDRGGKLQLALGRGEAVDLDCGACLRELLAPHGGKGGGKPDHARGGVEGVGVGALAAELASRLG